MYLSHITSMRQVARSLDKALPKINSRGDFRGDFRGVRYTFNMQPDAPQILRSFSMKYQSGL